ncbi:hypothetical protein B224_0461 [Aeromonas media WS]|nr:hypothetical protein B224_0461 [Aeromonas media WS]
MLVLSMAHSLTLFLFSLVMIALKGEVKRMRQASEAGT